MNPAVVAVLANIKAINSKTSRRNGEKFKKWLICLFFIVTTLSKNFANIYKNKNKQKKGMQ